MARSQQITDPLIGIALNDWLTGFGLLRLGAAAPLDDHLRAKVYLPATSDAP